MKRIHFTAVIISICIVSVFCFLFFTAQGRADIQSVSKASTYDGMLRLPASLQVIGESAFEGVAASSVRIADNTVRIEQRAFANMTSLRVVQIPESVVYFGDDIFANDTDITLFGAQGSRAEDYARKNGFRFRVILTTITSAQSASIKIKLALVLISLSYTLILMYVTHARFSGRTIGEAKSVRRRERVELHPLDMCFP